MSLRPMLERNSTPGNLPYRVVWYEYPEDIADRMYLIGTINSALLSLHSDEMLDMESDIRIIPGITPGLKIIRTLPHLIIVACERDGIWQMNIYDKRTHRDITVNLDSPTIRYLADCLPEEMAVRS